MNRWRAFQQMNLARMREFFREPHALFWVYGFPIILAFGLGIAFSGGKPKPPTIDILVDAESAQVNELAEELRKVEIDAHVLTEKECKDRLRKGKTDLIVVLKENGLEYHYDSARAESVLARHWVDAEWRRFRHGGVANPDVQASEPGTRYIDFLLPGLMGMNLMGGGLFGVGFNLVDMRVRKLFKRLMATPIHRGDFLLSIFTVRFVFLLPEMLVILLVGHWFFGVPLRGQWWDLLLVILIGAFSFSGIGLFLGCRTEKIETISGLINLLMLPMYILSGIFFSANRFPDSIQPLIQALPLTQLNETLREVMLEGAGLPAISWRLAILLGWGIITFTLGLRWFRWR